MIVVIIAVCGTVLFLVVVFGGFYLLRRNNTAKVQVTAADSAPADTKTDLMSHLRITADRTTAQPVRHAQLKSTSADKRASRGLVSFILKKGSSLQQLRPSLPVGAEIAKNRKR